MWVLPLRILPSRMLLKNNLLEQSTQIASEHLERTRVAISNVQFKTFYLHLFLSPSLILPPDFFCRNLSMP